MKKEYRFVANIYTAIASWAIIIFGIIIGSGLFIFIGFALLAVVFLSLRKAINKDNIIRIEHGKHVDIYCNDQLIDSYIK